MISYLDTIMNSDVFKLSICLFRGWHSSNNSRIGIGKDTVYDQEEKHLCYLGAFSISNNLGFVMKLCSQYILMSTTDRILFKATTTEIKSNFSVFTNEHLEL